MQRIYMLLLVVITIGFSKVIAIAEEASGEIFELDENNEEDKRFLGYFENAFYIVEYTFPKKIKSISVKHSQLSEDKRTVTYKFNWISFLRNPNLLDVNIEFENE